MKTTFRQSFTRDLKKIKDRALLDKIKEVIECAEAAQDLNQIEDLVKLSGPSGYYRMRMGDYRLGLALHGDELEFVRCLHRRDIYRYFP